MFIEEFTEELEFSLGDGVDQAYHWGLSIFQFNFEVIGPMRIECAGSFLVENVWKVMVFFRDGAEVNRCIRGHGAGFCSHLGEGKPEDFSDIHPA